MMTITFLSHSGFLVELPSVTLLFDWWKGELPALRPEAPLLVFASHRHEDHFNPEIFRLDDGSRDIHFLLGKGIAPSRNLSRWSISPDTAGKCLILRGNQRANQFPGILVETLHSTDEGVAFLVTADGQAIFHAGDLNWWHWTGEDYAWNQNMAANFRRYTEPLRGRRIDLAMLPLDPRLGENGFLGPTHFLRLADIRHFLPMHQWGNFAFTKQFLTRYPEFAERTVSLAEEGQSVSL